jgi:LAS superfamily LD-carboxypeptidase LdcB
MRKTLIVLFLSLSVPTFAQDAPKPVATTPVAAAKLERVDQLEQENIRLLAVLTQTQKDLAEVRAQLQQLQLQQRASAFTEKMKTAHPDFEVDPSTLELKPKAKSNTTEKPKVNP